MSSILNCLKLGMVSEGSAVLLKGMQGWLASTVLWLTVELSCCSVTSTSCCSHCWCSYCCSSWLCLSSSMCRAWPSFWISICTASSFSAMAWELGAGGSTELPQARLGFPGLVGFGRIV